MKGKKKEKREKKKKLVTCLPNSVLFSIRTNFTNFSCISFILDLKIIRGQTQIMQSKLTKNISLKKWWEENYEIFVIKKYEYQWGKLWNFHHENYGYKYGEYGKKWSNKKWTERNGIIFVWSFKPMWNIVIMRRGEVMKGMWSSLSKT